MALDRPPLDLDAVLGEVLDRALDRPIPDEAQVGGAGWGLGGGHGLRRRGGTVHVELGVRKPVGPAAPGQLDDLRAQHLAVERVRALPVGDGDDDVIEGGAGGPGHAFLRTCHWTVAVATVSPSEFVSSTSTGKDTLPSPSSVATSSSMPSSVAVASIGPSASFVYLIDASLASGRTSASRSAKPPTKAPPDAASAALNSPPGVLGADVVAGPIVVRKQDRGPARPHLGDLEAEVPVEGDRRVHPRAQRVEVHAHACVAHPSTARAASRMASEIVGWGWTIRASS